MRFPRALSWTLLAVACALGCAAPSGGLRELDGETFPPALVADAGQPTDQLLVEPLEQGGAVGGRVVFTVDGEPDEVLEMLLDFDHADGRRAWSTEHALLDREGDRATARWHLKGKAGIHPVVRLAFVTEREDEGEIRLTFDLVERTFGVAALFGDYHIVSDRAGGSLLAGRVFVASGLPIGPSTEDICDGMRVDAGLIRGWMQERVGERLAR